MNMALAVVNFTIGVLLARALGPELRGQYFAIALAISVAAQVSISGAHLLLGREAGCLNISSKSVHHLAYKIVFYLFIPGIFLLGLISCILNFNPANKLSIYAWIIAGAAIPFSQLNAIQLQIEIGRTVLNTYSRTLLIVAAVQATAAAVLFFTGNQDLYIYLTIILAGSITGTISCGILSFRHPTGSIKTNLLKKSLVELVSLGRRDSFGTIINIAVTIIDKMLVGLYFSPASLGVYAIASSVSHLQLLIAESASPLFFVNSTKTNEENKNDKNIAKINQLRKLILINFIVLIILLIASPWLLTNIFGTQYASGVILATTLLPGIAAQAATRPFQELMRANNMALQQSMITLSTFIIFFIFSSIAINNNSLFGVALAQTLTAVIAFATTIIISSRLLGVSIVLIIKPNLKDVVEIYFSIKKIISRGVGVGI